MKTKNFKYKSKSKRVKMRCSRKLRIIKRSSRKMKLRRIRDCRICCRVLKSSKTPSKTKSKAFKKIQIQWQHSKSKLSKKIQPLKVIYLTFSLKSNPETPPSNPLKPTLENLTTRLKKMTSQKILWKKITQTWIIRLYRLRRSFTKPSKLKLI